MKETKKNFKKGITLVALVITIVIMLILASVTIGAINGGLFEYAGKAKISTEESSKKEGIKESFILAKSKSKTGKITTEDLQKALDKIFEKDYAEAIDNEGGITIRIEDKYYDIDSKGTPGEGKTIKHIDYTGDITKKGKGTSDDPYRIECIEDLVGFSKDVNNGKSYSGKYVALTRDLDFNSIYSYANYKTTYSYDSSKNAYVVDDESKITLKELCLTGNGFIPIGNSSKSFSGVFDGQRNTISNIFEDYSTDTSSLCGLFGKATNIIKNITVEGNYIAYKSGGGIAGQFQGNILNCVNKVNIIQTNNFRDMGGIMGLAPARKFTMTNCINYGTIKYNGVYSGGAIIGSDGTNGISNVYIYNCANFGNAGALISVQTWSSTTHPTIANFFNYGKCSKITSSIGYYIYNNCFSLEGKINNTDPSIMIEKSEEYMKSEEFIRDLNSYIESNPEGINTVGWCQWITGENNLPALDFTKEWNGTEWVSVTN